jgi:UDP:flavonoid glycosyltransferase YjiC (YdhE family)
MTIVIVTSGSRGDTEPYVALGRELVARGHRVRLVASKSYRSLVEQAGIECFPLDIDMPTHLGSAEGKRWTGKGHSTLASLRGFRKVVVPMVEPFQAAAAKACEDATAVLFSHTGVAGYHIAEAYGVPCCLVEYLPRHPSGDGPSWLVPGRRSLGRLGNRASHAVANQLTWRIRRPGTNRWRTQELGLPPLPWWGGPQRAMAQNRVPRLCGYSSAVVPRPRDWPDYVKITGYWFLDRGEQNWQPPADLAKFLATGTRPVYVGFGSMVPADPVELDRTVRAALKKAGVRGVLLGNPSNEPVTDQFFPLTEAPHSWLFPRMAAIVHHAGAGTTAASLRAGVPNVVCPFFVDALFWAERVHQLGAGPEPVPIGEVSVDSLAAAVSKALATESYRAKAADLGRRIRAEDGVNTACDLLEQWLASNPPVPGGGLSARSPRATGSTVYPSASPSEGAAPASGSPASE